MKCLAITALLVTVVLTGCKPADLKPASFSRDAAQSGATLMSPGAMIEQEHKDRLERIRRLAEKYNVPAPTVDQQLLLPAHLFGTDRDLPVMRVAWGDQAFFATDRAQPRSESRPILHTLADVMKSDLPDTHLLVVGHTDARASLAYNENLSLRRAENVVKELVNLGVRKNQISYIGMGEIQPLASNMTPTGMASNRRVEFFLGAYSDLTTEAVSRVPFDALDRRLPDPPSSKQHTTPQAGKRNLADSQQERELKELTEETRVAIYSPAEREVAAEGQQRVNRDQQQAIVSEKEGQRSVNQRTVARETTIGGRERMVDSPAAIYREPAIGNRNSGF